MLRKNKFTIISFVISISLIVFLIPIFTSEALAPVPIDQSTVGYWKLDDNTATTTVKDWSGYLNNGTTSATTTINMSTTTAKFGRAMKFNGTTDRISLGNSSIFNLTTGGTWSAWVKTISTAYQGVIGRDNGVTRSYTFGLYGSSVAKIYMQVSAVDKLVNQGPELQDNKWHHIAVTGSTSNGWKSYVDGVLIQSASWSAPSSGSLNTYIGQREFSGWDFNGTMDDVRIYNRALTANEIKRLYMSGQDKSVSKVGFSKGNPTPIDNSTVGYWKLDDNAADRVVKDWTSYANTGSSTRLTNLMSTTIAKFGRAMTFNGTSDYVLVADSDSLDVTTSFTISGWGEWDGGTKPSLLIFKKLTSWSENTGYALNVGPSVSSIDVYGSGSTYARWTIGATVDIWYHYAATINGTQATLFINGVSQGAKTISAVVAGTQPIRIGSRETDNLSYTDGSIDDVRIYNRALTANEIKRLYMAGR